MPCNVCYAPQQTRVVYCICVALWLYSLTGECDMLHCWWYRASLSKTRFLSNTRWLSGFCASLDAQRTRLYAIGILAQRWCFYCINPTVVHSAKPRAWESLWKAHWSPVWWKQHCSPGWSRLHNADREVWSHSRSGLVGGSGMPVIFRTEDRKHDEIGSLQNSRPTLFPALPNILATGLCHMWGHCLFRSFCLFFPKCSEVSRYGGQIFGNRMLCSLV